MKLFLLTLLIFTACKKPKSTDLSFEPVRIPSIEKSAEKPSHIPEEEIPLEEIPLEEIPLEEIPLEEIPLEEIPAAEVPAEEIPETPYEEESALNGTWVSQCDVYEGEWAYNFQTVVKIDGHKMISTTTAYDPNDEACTNPRYSDIFEVGFIKDKYSLYLKTFNYSMQLHHPEEVSYFNKSKICQLSDWKIKETRNLSEANCNSASLVIRQESYLIRGKKLEIGNTLYSKTEQP